MALDITSIANTTATNSTNSSSTVGNDEDLGKVDFLNLLVAQMSNQDPLNPDEGTEFAAQLAQYSSLEQLMNLNTIAGTMLQASANSDNIALLNTIGNDVLYYGNEFNFDGEPVEMGYALATDATEVTVDIILDGQTIRSISAEELSQGNHTFTWDGLDKDGNPAPKGDYTIEVAASKSGTDVVSATVLKAEVTSVNLDPSSGATLTTTLGGIKSYSYILGIYQRNESPVQPETPSA